MTPQVNRQLGRVLGTVRTDLASGGNENRFETCFKDCVGMEGEIITKIGVEMGDRVNRQKQNDRKKNDQIKKMKGPKNMTIGPIMEKNQMTE